MAKQVRRERTALSLETFDKIPHSIWPKLEAIGITDAGGYRLLDMITFSDANNRGNGCIIRNVAFLEILGISEGRLKRLMRALEEAGFIRREIVKALVFQNNKRVIHPSDEVRGAWIAKYEKAGMTALVDHYTRLTKEEVAFNGDAEADESDDEDGGGSNIKPRGVKNGPTGGRNRPILYNKNNREESFSVSKETEKGGANDAPQSAAISIEEFLPNQGNENPAKKNHDPAAMKAALREQLPAPDNSSDELTWEDASEEARTMLEFWNAAGCGTQHKSDGPGARKALHVLDCVILPQGYSISKLVDAAEHFALVAKDGTQHISLSDFLVVSEFRKRAARNRKAPAPRPTFLEFYSDNGDGAAIIGEEEFRLYKSLKKAYIGWTLGVEQSESPLSLKEGRQLLQAAVKLKACMAKGWLDPYFVGSKPTHIDYINILFQGLKRKWKNDYTTGHVASDKIWDKWMPRFIQESRGISVIKMRESIEHDGQ